MDARWTTLIGVGEALAASARHQHLIHLSLILRAARRKFLGRRWGRAEGVGRRGGEALEGGGRRRWALAGGALSRWTLCHPAPVPLDVCYPALTALDCPLTVGSRDRRRWAVLQCSGRRWQALAGVGGGAVGKGGLGEARGGVCKAVESLQSLATVGKWCRPSDRLSSR